MTYCSPGTAQGGGGAVREYAFGPSWSPAYCVALGGSCLLSGLVSICKRSLHPPTHTRVPTLVWASLRMLAGSWRRQDTISWTDELGQPTSFAKAAACCRALSGLMTAAGESAEPPWKREQTQRLKSRSSPTPCSAQRPQGCIRALRPSSRCGSPRTLPSSAHRRLGGQG